MKAERIMALLLLAAGPTMSASAQVQPLGSVRQTGSVQRASCNHCGQNMIDGGPIMVDSGTVWGTSIPDCNLRPGLYPPCPNPCQTTLLGELVCGIKHAVDCSLSRVGCCLFGGICLPCGCHDVCGCAEPACGSIGYAANGCDAAVDGGGWDMAAESMAAPSVPQQPTPAPLKTQTGDPFRDDPAPNTGVQPVPSGSTTRSLVPTPRAASRRGAGSRVQRTSYVQPPVSRPARLNDHQVQAEPIRPVRSPNGHYQPRRTTTLRQTHGGELQLTPVQDSETAPPLRFRESE